MKESKGPAHEPFMRRALELAREGWGQTAPNPMVGAVVVRDDQIVGEGFHAKYGGEHAEVAALRKAGAQARGATLYVTLEPCRHHGKTPPCTDAIFASGIARVVYAIGDPSPVAGGGAAELQSAMIDVVSGVLRTEARELNAPFFHSISGALPWTTLKLAVSMEMAIANQGGSTTWLTSEESRAEVHRMRAGHDAVAVGVGTILADDPQLNVRDAPKPRKPPARVVFDRSLRTPQQSKVVFTARDVPTIVLTSDAAPADKSAALRDAGVHVLTAPDLREGFRRLRSAGIRSLLVEGGATIANAVVDDGLAHRLVVFQAPVSLGAGALHAFEGAGSGLLGRLELLRMLERRSVGPDTMTTYVLQEWT